MRLQKALMPFCEVVSLDKSIDRSTLSDYCLLMQSNVLICEDAVNNLIQIINEYPQYEVLVPVSNETNVELQRQSPPFIYQTPTVFKWAVEEVFCQFGKQVVDTDVCDDFCLFFRRDLLSRCALKSDSLVKMIKNNAIKCGIAKGVYVHRYGNCYESPRSDLLPYIPLDAKKVLDVGCARGLLGEVLKKRQGCIVEGIDIDSNLIEWAKKRLDTAILGDIERLAGTDELGQYDCIICGDVLEHLYDPYDVLKRLKGHLSIGGLLIATVPNVNNWAIIYEMLQGRWDYVPFSILSATHIRFFTKDTVIEMFQNCGYKIKEVHFTRFDIPIKGRDFVECIKLIMQDVKADELTVSEITIIATMG